jgi:tripartite-type tricarboxylate transporter receptor subunit TctC
MDTPEVSYASQGNGTTSHLTVSMFMQLTGTEMIHIPYKGTAPALVDLIGG